MSNASTISWICTVCGYVHEGNEPPEVCPVCGAGADAFEKETSSEPPPIQTPIEWICSLCGFLHEGESPPDVCPVCEAEPEAFERMEETQDSKAITQPSEEYLSEWAKREDSFEKKFSRMVELAKYGKSDITPMRTQKSFPDWDLILFKGAQLDRFPLNENEEVVTNTIIGKTAKQPLEMAIPFYVSHMSFGALSREAKIALAKGSNMLGTAICSGEGGMLPEERQEAGCYIYELGTASFSHIEDSMRQADAVELKIGQAAKPGLGGHLPKEKITEEIAQIRNVPLGQDSISPGRPFYLKQLEDLKALVDKVREIIQGKPVGIKITAGHIEKDIDAALKANPDFITIDCRGGATGAAPTFVKDNVCLPPIYAIRRARRYLDQVNSHVTLCITGGFRDSADIAKGLALGADAIALATASLIAIGCQQYRICHSGNCPVGITTQDTELRNRFNIDESVKRFVNYYTATNEELKTFARINGRNSIHGLDITDVFTLNHEIAHYTDIEHA